MTTTGIFATKTARRAAGIFALAATFLLPGVPTWAAPGHGAGTGHGYTDNIGEPAKPNPATRTINIQLGDNFYKPAAVKVRAGETVRFVLTNTGELLHEFNIGTSAMHAEHQAEMLAMMDAGMLTATDIVTHHAGMDHSKMGHGAMKHDDPNSVLLRPGESGELVWKFTNDVDLQFACNVPGHYEAGMVGNVEFRK